MEKESYLLELARHIVLNPARAKMVRTVKNWPWSSYHATIGAKACQGGLNPNWLLASFAKHKSVAIERYKQFIADGRNQPAPWEPLTNQVFLGSEQFIYSINPCHNGVK